jgi:hypothetical protein
MYTLIPGKPCWVLEYSALQYDFISGHASEDPTFPMPWPCALPDGWSVEWDPSPANTDHNK